MTRKHNVVALLTILVFVIFVLVVQPGVSRNPNTDTQLTVREQLLGSWNLQSRETTLSDGKVVVLPRVPDLESQRAAMKKLNFLVGEWAGEARVMRGPGESTELVQTEEARYKLDGLILTIEGVGRTKSDGKPILQALGVISYDDESKTYQMRAFNDGRFLETEVKLPGEGQGMTWGFTLGEIRTKSVMRINDRGEWTELHEITIGSQPPKKLMELVVRRQK